MHNNGRPDHPLAWTASGVVRSWKPCSGPRCRWYRGGRRAWMRVRSQPLSCETELRGTERLQCGRRSWAGSVGMGGAGVLASGWSGFGRCPARLGVGHGQGAVRCPATRAGLSPARNVSEWPPGLARRGAPAGEVAKAAEAGRPSPEACPRCSRSRLRGRSGGVASRGGVGPGAACRAGRVASWVGCPPSRCCALSGRAAVSGGEDMERRGRGAAGPPAPPARDSGPP
jgi:hypothetical protein